MGFGMFAPKMRIVVLCIVGGCTLQNGGSKFLRNVGAVVSQHG